jgi:glycosyltransferase involved in cell wall biosynthesis
VKRQHTIVIDGLSALQGGGQTYLINLFRHFPDRLADSLNVVAIIPKGGSVFRVNDRIDYVDSPFASAGLLRRLIWSKVALPHLMASRNAGVLYCPGGFVSAFGAWKTAVAFRNMLPFSDENRKRYGFGYMRTRLFTLRFVQARSFRKADLVVFISQFAKSIIDIVVPKREGKSAVITHGINEQFRDPPPASADALPALPPRYVAYVSILTVYKAQVEVVRAWALMRKQRRGTEKLLLVGPTYHDYARDVQAAISECGLQDEVMILGDVPYAALPAVYHGAIANIFASSCENCPNILLEALAAGRPVLCSDYQPMPEFAGDAALYFDPYNPETLATQLTRVLDDAELRDDLGRKTLARAAHFQWKEAAEKTWQALFELAAGTEAAGADACAE